MIKHFKQINIVILLFGLVALFSACSSENERAELRTGKIFFNDTANVLWRHQVNTIEELQKYSQVFKGIEFDLMYYPERKVFEVEYGANPNSEIKLIDYFGSIPNPSEKYFWLDIKNLKYEYVDELIERLLFVLNTYGIKNNVICESWNLKALKKLNEAGIYTSYWIPDFPYNGQISKEQQEILDKIHDVLKDCKHNAISAPYKMLPFIKDHLADCTVHLWTNGLKTEEDKVLIKDIANTNCVKVVLVDYEEPF